MIRYYGLFSDAFYSHPSFTVLKVFDVSTFVYKINHDLTFFRNVEHISICINHYAEELKKKNFFCL